MEEEIKSIIENASYSPCILLGKYASEFKRIYDGRIFLVNSLESVREITNNYSNISSLDGMLFVIDGIGFLSETAQSALLKFIEESKFPVILLSYYDKISPIILSRMKFVYKHPISDVKQLKFTKLGACLDLLDDKYKEAREKGEDFTEMDKIKFYSTTCPIAFFFENNCVTKDRVSRRVNKIIGKC